jgi:hypothetical protein
MFYYNLGSAQIPFKMSAISLAQPLLMFDTNIVGEFSDCVISIQQSAKYSIYSLPPEHEHKPMAGILLYISAPIVKGHWVGLWAIHLT